MPEPYWKQQARERERQHKQKMREQAQEARRAARQQRSGWTPRASQNPDVGVVEETDDPVSFKTQDDNTIIADGDYSEGDGTGAKEAREAFDGTKNDRGHDHYGPWGGTDRGKYTGPDH